MHDAKSLKKGSFWKNNSLSIVFLALFIAALFAQSLSGYHVFNDERKDDLLLSPVSYWHYLTTAHFLEATFENFESEFLQMALFVVLAIKLRQKGSTESKSVDGKESVDREPDAKRQGAPWAVRKGGGWLWLYKRSLSIAFFSLFFASIMIHYFSSLRDYNYQQLAKKEPTASAIAFIAMPDFWFESFQNWQSEFLSIFCIIVFTIYLRQFGSPQSKPVDSPHCQNE